MMTQQSTVRHARQPSPPIPHRYPFGLRVIIVLFLVKTIGIITILVLVTSTYLWPDLQIESAALVQSPQTLVMYVVLAPLDLLAAIGLWRRKRWAWVLTMALLAFSMTLDIVSFLRGQPIYISMVLNVVQVGYLNQQEVQDLFGEKSRPKTV
jgi:uncharacterized membrane protein (DUF2068 family)